MKYCKKPVEIEAFKWTGGIDQTEEPEWIVKAIKDGVVSFRGEGTPKVHMLIDTLEGVMTAQVGDYIIKGVHGEFYACKPNIFEETYEPSIGLPIDISKAKCISISTHELAEKLAKPIKNAQRRKGFL